MLHAHVYEAVHCGAVYHMWNADWLLVANQTSISLFGNDFYSQSTAGSNFSIHLLTVISNLELRWLSSIREKTLKICWCYYSGFIIRSELDKRIWLLILSDSMTQILWTRSSPWLSVCKEGGGIMVCVETTLCHVCLCHGRGAFKLVLNIFPQLVH